MTARVGGHRRHRPPLQKTVNFVAMLEEARMFFKKGEELAKVGRWEEAVKAYEESLRVNPNDAQTHLNLGFVYYELGYDAEAQQAFERARKLQACCGK